MPSFANRKEEASAINWILWMLSIMISMSRRHVGARPLLSQINYIAPRWVVFIDLYFARRQRAPLDGKYDLSAARRSALFVYSRVVFYCVCNVSLFVSFLKIISYLKLRYGVILWILYRLVCIVYYACSLVSARANIWNNSCNQNVVIWILASFRSCYKIYLR